MTEHEIKTKRSRQVFTGAMLVGILKFLISFLMIYEGWYIEKFGAIPYLLQLLAALVVIFALLCTLYNPKGKKYNRRIAVWWLCFGVIAFIVGLFTSYVDVVNNALSTYFSFLIVCICIGSIVQYDNENWISRTMIIITALCALSATFFGYNYINEGYSGITMSADNNPNNLGMVMSIGVFYLLMPNKKQSLWMWAVRIILVGVYLNVIVNTGSRSGVLCLATIVGFSMFFNFKFLRGSESSKILKRILLGIVCVGAVFLVLHYIQGIGSGTSGINRLLDNFNTKSYGGRTRLYVIAFKIFLQKPIFGVGYYGFSVVSNLHYYSHSTYMELLSCTGIVGFLLFFIPIVKGAVNSIKYRHLDKGRSITLLLLFAVGGFFGILYYNLIFMILIYWTVISMNKMIMEKANDQNDCG